MPKCRAKSDHRPEATNPSTASGDTGLPCSKKPLTASFRVPSPPTTMMSRWPPFSASRTRWAVWPRSRLNAASIKGKALCRPARMCGQARPVLPRAERGLTTTKAVMAWSCRTGREYRSRAAGYRLEIAKAGRLLDLAFLEDDMLAQHRVVFLDREFLGHRAGVLLADIEKAGVAFAVETNFGGGRFGHQATPRKQIEGAGFAAKGAPLSSVPT